ncbi:MAG: isopeptide-forming domain-containing fimbrial protein, partial [Elusimicrobiota bacterium]
MTLVPGTLTVSWDGHAAVPVPAGSVIQSSGALRFTADFLGGPGYINDATVAGHSVSFSYKVTDSDAILAPGTEVNLSHFSNFEVGGGPIGACTDYGNTKIIQYAGNSLARAKESLSLAMPAVVDVCQTFMATATLTTANFPVWGSSAAILTAGNYTYDTALNANPVYGGQFTSGNISYSANSGVNPSFLYTPASLTGSGTIGVFTRRKAGTGTANSPLSATGEYDDWQTDVTPARDFGTGASAAPVFTRVGRLSLTTTPQSASITGKQTEWKIYVTNTGDGGIYNAVIKDIVPAGLEINVSSTNAQNLGYDITSVIGSTVIWSQAPGGLPIDISAGAGIVLTVFADVAPGVCSIPANANTVPAFWGCDGVNQEVLTKNDLNLSFPSGSMQATHDSANTFTRLCSSDYDTIIMRNTGLTHLYDAEAYEVLDTGGTGISFVPASVQVSTDSGATWTSLGASGDPTGAGTPGDKYTWTKAQVPQLADIAPYGEAGGYSSVRLRFKVAASETANGFIPQITAGAKSSRACGDVITDPGTPYTLLVKKPDITVSKTGKNITAGDASYSETVYGGQGDQIEWRTVVQNTGEYEARQLRFVDILPTDGGGATVSGPGITGTPALTSNLAVRVSTLAAYTGSSTYLVTETLGGTCVSQNNTASLSWGCLENADGLRSNLSSPTTSTDTAQLVMFPTFVNAYSNITFNTLPGGRAEVVMRYTNSGGTAEGLLVVSTIPAGMLLDNSFTPTYATDGGITAMTPDLGSLSSPRFAFTGSLRNSRYLEIRYRVLQTGNFDVNTSSFTNPETVGAGTDPAFPAGGTLYGEINFDSTCGNPAKETLNAVLDPKTPDVDMTVSPASVIVADGASKTFDFTLVNNGDTGSTADHIAWALPAVGTGWTITAVTVQTPGAGGSGGACGGAAPYTCAAGQIGSLAAGASAVVRVVATASDNGGDLSMVAQVEGSLYADDGSDTGSNYSLDQSAPKVVGVSLSKTLIATSETFTSTTTLAIGEEATFRLRARWFGGEDIGAITLRDTLPAGLGFVSASTTTSHDLSSATVSGANPYNFTVNTFSGAGTLEIDLVARALNVAGNTNGKVNLNNLGLSFASLGVTYASNNGTDGFGGTYAALHTSTATTIARPALSIDKMVKNSTLAGAYAQTGSGQAGHTMQYRVIVANSGAAPAFDITMPDALTTNKLTLIDGASDGVDNDGDGAVDDATEGYYYAVAAGSVTFNNANTGLTSGASFGRLDPGQQLTLTYRAEIGGSASPNDSLLNGAAFSASSLPGDTGNQTGTLGVPGASNGELQLAGTDSAAVLVSTIASFSKVLTNTAQGPDVSTNVLVGEQVEFHISLILPAGTVTNFNIYDTLPAGLSLVQTPPVTIGSAITQAQPSITPGTLPASGPHVVWNFGTVTVSSNSTNAERTITIPYITQVLNTAANVHDLALVNSSSYSYVGSLPVNNATVSIRVKEPGTTLTLALSTATPNFDAGSVIVATVTVASLSGRPTAYNENVVLTLPSYLSYQSVTPITGTSIGAPDIAVYSSTKTLTWGRTQAVPQDIDVTSSTVFKFQVNLLVADTVRPGQLVNITGREDWTSLDVPGVSGSPGPDLGVAVGSPGAANGERNGDGPLSTSLNNYFKVASATMTVGNVYSLVKSSSASTLSDGSFRIGDLITYTVSATFQEGTVTNARIQDTLPAGLAYDSLVSLLPASGGAFTYSAPSVAGSTGTLAWNFGTVVNTGNNDTADNILTL